ncbi:hypothetical protein U8P76_05830 [Rhizobium johnstonii]|nr:hypothetical protein U8P76_05830 [Rhizobium johnstonii]
MATLSPAELAALDFIIEAKKADMLPAGFINNIVNDANNLVNNVGNAANAVAAVTAAAAAVAAVATGLSVQEGALGLGGGDELSVDQLLSIRKQALSQ